MYIFTKNMYNFVKTVFLCMYNFCAKKAVHVQFLINFREFCCTCTTSMLRKLYMYNSECTFFKMRCTTRCTVSHQRNGGHVPGLDAITLEEARQIPLNSPSEGDFCAYGSALVKEGQEKCVRISEKKLDFPSKITIWDCQLWDAKDKHHAPLTSLRVSGC